MNERGTRELNAILIKKKRECKPNESMDFNDPKEFDDPQVFDDPKGTSIGSMNLIIQKSSFPMVLFVCLWFAIFVSDKG